MKKKLNSMTIEISYKVAETSDSINDAIGRKIHEVETLTAATLAERKQLVAFIKENREAIDVDAVTATLKANGYAKQRISELLLSYGIRRKAQKKTCASAALQKEVMAELAILQKKHTDKKKLKALLIRMYRAL
jgi:hypothetical protein